MACHIRERRRCLIASLLCVISIAFFNGYPRYQAEGRQRLRDPLLQSLAAWGGEQSNVQLLPAAEGGGARLFASHGQAMHHMGQKLDGPLPPLLLLSCDIKSQQVVGGQLDWETARVVMISYDHAGKPRYERPHLLANLTGSHDWQHVEKAFIIEDMVAELEVAAQLIHSSGQLSVRNFSLLPIRIKPQFLQLRRGLLIVWSVTFCWLALPLLRASRRSRPHAMVLGLIAAILVGVLLPHDLKTQLGAALRPTAAENTAHLLQQVLVDEQFFHLTLAAPTFDLFKAGHFLLFALLAAALHCGQAYGLSARAILGYLTLLASASETLQLFIPGRSAQLADIIIDLSGAGCGLSLAGLRLLRRRF